jgi:hypothetical protein
MWFGKNNWGNFAPILKNNENRLFALVAVSLSTSLFTSIRKTLRLKNYKIPIETSLFQQ